MASVKQMIVKVVQKRPMSQSDVFVCRVLD